MIILLSAVLFCFFYTVLLFKDMEMLEETENIAGIIISGIGCLAIFSVCLLSGFFIRLLIFKKTYKNLKTLIFLIPVIISFILLAAHFMRDNDLIFAFFVLALLFIILYFLVPASVKAAKVMLLFGTIEWIRSGYALASIRLRAGEPYIRLVIIMGGVAFFTLLSSLAFYTKPVKERYNISNKD